MQILRQMHCSPKIAHARRSILIAHGIIEVTKTLAHCPVVPLLHKLLCFRFLHHQKSPGL